MKMKQREILNRLNLDFARDGERQEDYIAKKIEQIKQCVKEYLSLSGMKGFVLGLSGGIDSFAAAALIADASKDSGGILHLLLLPNGVQKDIQDAEACRDHLTSRFHNIECETISIEHGYAGVVEDIKNSILYDEKDRYSLGNIQARLRMVTQYALARGLLVAGTDHATENVTGYFTKYGDGGTDFNPLDGLIKADIYDIAFRYGAPECVMRKAPTAGLGISENDETELGMTYLELAEYLKGNLIDKEKMQRIVSLYERSEHKRNLPASPMNLWWKNKREDVSLVVVDMIHAFVDGSMACKNAQSAVAQTVNFINEHPEIRTLYVRDQHGEDHCSFETNGGQWPVHAVKGTPDGEIVPSFYQVHKTINSPIARYNIFDKGTDATREEYSGFGAINEHYGALKYNLTRTVIVSGIATEYCVKNTVEDLVKNGFDVSVLERGLAYIDQQAHRDTLLHLHEMGVKIL